ncbi:MAG: putative thiol:disulfide interchange protein DsbC [Burkholderiaceae bacterium]|nr:putative thiol:disulfide interchange protein DsbC [Burkholderiaceae bacterium]
MLFVRTMLAVCALAMTIGASADEAAIRKNLAARLPNFPPIDEVSKTPVPGLYEVRIGTDVLYTDEQGQYVIQGSIIDTKTRANLTEARIAKLTQIDFASLPLKDAFLIKQGNGSRKLAVFADPNCGYCKRLERDLVALKDVSIYTFLYPILGPDSNVKSRDIWCAREPGKVWRSWMVDGATPPKAMGACDAVALERNLALGSRHRVNGTPAVVFEDGTRSPGALPLEQLESRLLAAAKR